MSYKVGFTSIDFRHVTGKVIGQQQHWASTETYGGGAYTTGNTVHVSPVSSETYQHSNFWIRTPEGQEIAINTTDVNVSVREGHEVVVVYLVHKGREEVYAIKDFATQGVDAKPMGRNRLLYMQPFWWRKVIEARVFLGLFAVLAGGYLALAVLTGFGKDVEAAVVYLAIFLGGWLFLRTRPRRYVKAFHDAANAYLASQRANPASQTVAATG